jgi:hypothetical protein
MKEGLSAELGPLGEILADKETPDRMKIGAIRGWAEALREEAKRDALGPVKKMMACLQGLQAVHPPLRPAVAAIREAREGLLSLALTLERPFVKTQEKAVEFVKRVDASSTERVRALEEHIERYRAAWERVVDGLQEQEDPTSP